MLSDIVVDNTNCRIEGLSLAKNLQRITVMGGNDYIKELCDNNDLAISVDSETMKMALQQGI